MDGVHDLGGAAGFGRVEVEHDEPVFHAAWEGRVFGLAAALSLTGATNTPMFRHSIERMEPTQYLAGSYYEHWLTGVATLFVELGLVDIDELQSRSGGFPLSRPVAADPLPPALTVEPQPAPRFAVGERVRVRNLHPLGHTRCPDYVRDRVGEVTRIDPNCPVAELEAHRQLRVTEPTYCVRFSCSELWGSASDPDSTVSVDLYQRYLEACGE